MLPEPVERLNKYALYVTHGVKDRLLIHCWNSEMGLKKRKRQVRPSTAYLFHRSRQLDGTLNNGPRYGSYCITAARVLASWGTISEKRFPVPKPLVWPFIEPPGVDRIAKYQRSNFHFRVRSINDAKVCLAAGMPFSFSVPISVKWRNTNDGRISNLTKSDVITEYHAVMAMGYDDHTQLLKFRNSWGENWGDKGYGYLPYAYFENFISDAWCSVLPLAHRLPRSPGHLPARQVDLLYCLGHKMAKIDLWDLQNDIRIGWSFMTLRDGYLDVEDFFIRPDYLSMGHGQNLSVQTLALARKLNMPLRVWIAHADARYAAANFTTINDFVRRANLTMKRTLNRWAAYVAI